MTDIDLVVTDLDGTLWEQPDETPSRTLDAVAEVRGRGIPLLVATGRRLGSTRRPLEALGLRPPAVMLNGSLGVDLSSDERFHLGGFTTESAARILATFASAGLEPCVYVDDDTHPVRIGVQPATHGDHLASFGDDVREDDLAAVVEDHRILAFSVLGIHESAAVPLGDALAGAGEPHVAPDRSYGGYGVTVAPPGDSKWDGIAAFCAREGLDPTRVLAIGDGPNDIEMLGAAAVAVVPEDGHPAALALADHVCARAAVGGWAELVDLL